MSNKGTIRAFLFDALALAGLLACWLGLWVAL